MFRRKLLAAACSVAILLVSTAVQAAPSTTVSLSSEWTSGAAGDMIQEAGSITVTQAHDGAVSLSFVISRTILCSDDPTSPTTERWEATNVPASLSIKNNLASGSAVATVTGGFTVTSNCPEVIEGAGDVGLVTIDILANNRTVRERTADGVRILTRDVDVTIAAGSLDRQGAGKLVKNIG